MVLFHIAVPCLIGLEVVELSPHHRLVENFFGIYVFLPKSVCAAMFMPDFAGVGVGIRILLLDLVEDLQGLIDFRAGSASVQLR
jgi:hypothetical protein